MVIKTSGVDKVAQEEDRESEGKRAVDSSEQHPHLRGAQKQRHVQRSWRKVGERWVVSLRPREECFDV